ncbi:MAG: hypothetical protein AAF413_03920 [Patescibacteria group bacterium]
MSEFTVPQVDCIDELITSGLEVGVSSMHIPSFSSFAAVKSALRFANDREHYREDQGFEVAKANQYIAEDDGDILQKLTAAGVLGRACRGFIDTVNTVGFNGAIWRPNEVTVNRYRAGNEILPHHDTDGDINRSLVDTIANLFNWLCVDVGHSTTEPAASVWDRASHMVDFSTQPLQNVASLDFLFQVAGTKSLMISDPSIPPLDVCDYAAIDMIPGTVIAMRREAIGLTRFPISHAVPTQTGPSVTAILSERRALQDPEIFQSLLLEDIQPELEALLY